MNFVVYIVLIMLVGLVCLNFNPSVQTTSLSNDGSRLISSYDTENGIVVGGSIDRRGVIK